MDCAVTYLTLEPNAFEFSGFRLKLLPDKSIGGDELLSPPTDKLGMLSSSGRAGSSGPQFNLPRVGDREVFTDTEAIVFGFGDSVQNLPTRPLDVRAALQSERSSLPLHITLITHHSQVEESSIQGGVGGFPAPRGATRCGDVPQVLLESRFRRFRPCTPSDVGIIEI